MTTRGQLVPVDGGTPIELSRDLMLVGRAEDCEIRLDDKSISKQHCVLVCTDGVIVLRDLGSTNGTRVNGTRVRRAVMVPGDTVAFAAQKFTIVVGKRPITPEAPTEQVDSQGLQSLLAQPELLTNSPALVAIKHEELPDVYPED